MTAPVLRRGDAFSVKAAHEAAARIGLNFDA
jgi:hypothetical protein